MEVKPDGSPHDGWAMCYIQQHEPYLGMELIYRGRVAEGLDILHRRNKITWEVNANPWGQALCVQAPSGKEINLFDYMSSTSTWNVLYALTGATFDAENKLLRFKPQLAGSKKLRIPVFLQDRWLTLDVDLDRSNPVTIQEVLRTGNAVDLTSAVVELPGLGVKQVQIDRPKQDTKP